MNRSDIRTDGEEFSDQKVVEKVLRSLLGKFDAIVAGSQRTCDTYQLMS